MTDAPRYCPDCGVRKANAIALGTHRRLAHGVVGDQGARQRRYKQRVRVARLRRFLEGLAADRLVRIRVAPGRTRATRVAIPAGELRDLLRETA